MADGHGDFCEAIKIDIKDLMNKIINSISVIRKSKRLRPTTELIFTEIKKDLPNLKVEKFKFLFDNLVDRKLLEIKGETDTESIFVSKSVKDFYDLVNDDDFFSSYVCFESELVAKETANNVSTNILNSKIILIA